MELFEGLEVVDSHPALYIEELDAAVVADLHLGLESLMARDGTYMPKFQLDEMKQELEEILEETGAGTVVVCGDVKHEFSETSRGEREEVQELLEFLAEKVDEVLLVKGNHDNYLFYAVENYDNLELDDYFLRDGVLFLHGHELLENLETLDADYVVMGHEHPAIAMRDEVGIEEKLPAFLYGEMEDGRNLVVLPAMSRLAEGSQVNRADGNELLSPVLEEKVDLEGLEAVGVDREAGLFEFPELYKFR